VGTVHDCGRRIGREGSHRMIKINLLPAEYRRRTQTPVKFIVATSCATALSGVLVAVWAWLAFGVAAQVDSTKQVRQMEMDGLSPQVAYNEALQAEVAIFSSREATLSAITKNRILWTEKMDQLVDIVEAGNEAEHFIWFDDLTVRQETASRGSANYGSFRANGHSGSGQFNQVANFMDDVVDKDLTNFVRGFNSPKLPEGTKNSREEDLIPSVNWSFPLSLSLLSPDERFALRNTGGQR
jgi:hypothetical protein